jgi:hypothetical protein
VQHGVLHFTNPWRAGHRTARHERRIGALTPRERRSGAKIKTI